MLAVSGPLSVKQGEDDSERSEMTGRGIVNKNRRICRFTVSTQPRRDAGDHLSQLFEKDRGGLSPLCDLRLHDAAGSGRQTRRIARGRGELSESALFRRENEWVSLQECLILLYFCAHARVAERQTRWT
jgi:hypothetical protein